MTYVKDNTLISAVPFSPSESYCSSANISGTSIQFIVDTGAAVSLLRSDIWDSLISARNTKMDPLNGQQLIGVDGSPLHIQGCVQVSLKIAEVNFNGNFIVVDNLKAEGLDFLKEHLCNIDIPSNCISFLQKKIKVPLQNKSTTNQISAQLVQTVHIPPQCEKEVLGLSQVPCSSNQP